MQTQINRKNIIIERVRKKKREETAKRDEKEERHSRDKAARGARRGREGSKVAHHTRAFASVGACALSQGELLSFAAVLQKRPDKGTGIRGPRAGTDDVFRSATAARFGG